MSSSAMLHGDKGHLRLEILGYENPHSKDFDDANWLEARLEVQAGPFSGSFKLALTTGELGSLYQQLAKANKTLSDRVDFTSMEETFSLKVEFSRTGAATLCGVTTPKGGQGNSLHYRFCSEPVTLEAAVSEFARLVERFPAKQSA
jgi:hypothetical protein